MRLDIDREGREWFYFPFWGLDGNTPDISVTFGTWQAMTAAPSYEPVTPVAVGAEWFRVLIAGPDASANPAGTVVVPGIAQARFRATEAPEVVIPTEPVWLSVPIVHR